MSKRLVSGRWGVRWLTIFALVVVAPAAGAQGVYRRAQHDAERGAVMQASRVVQLLPGFQLGGALPTGELGDLYSTGIRGGLTLTAVVPTQPYGVRAAVTHDRFGGGTVTPPGQSPVTIEGARMTSLSISGLVSERAVRSALLYFSAGVGVHRLDARSAGSIGSGDEEPVDDPDDPLQPPAVETRFGASVGGGINFRFAGLPSYVEIQVVKLFGADVLVVPLVFGIQLGK